MSKTAVSHGAKPARSSSVAKKPARSSSVATKPARSSSVASKPAQSSSVATKPARSSSVASKPGQSTSVATKPARSSSVASKPARSTSVASKPSLVRRPRAGAISALDRRFYIACGVTSLLSTVTIIAMGFLYINLKEVESPHDTPMEQLRDTLAAALRRPDLKYSSAMQLAEEVKNLPTNIKLTQAVYDERKKKYYNLFHKIMRSSSGPWKLHGRSLYYFSKGAKTWYDAENFCISRDAHLASILNEEEQNFTRSQFQHTSWIGLTAENEEGMWRWSDGSRLVTQYWSDGKPSNAEVFGESSQDCTLMVPSLPNHNWKDESCHKLYGWICKENLDLEEP